MNDLRYLIANIDTPMFSIWYQFQQTNICKFSQSEYFLLKWKIVENVS